MGVSALFYSLVGGVSQHLDPVEFVVFDNGLGCRSEILPLPDGRQIDVIRVGARGGRRYYRPENLTALAFLSRCGGLGSRLNRAISLIDSCDAVLDVSGGDSFSDIYGTSRFENIVRPKEIALARNRPLVLLPQTYGPYKRPAVRARAEDVVRGAAMAWARDPDSHAALVDLLGRHYDPDRHLCGVDMAFALPPKPAAKALEPDLAAWIDADGRDHPLVGINVSGLIFNDQVAAQANYGLKADYREVMRRLLERLLQRTACKIVLVPHVMDQPGHYESDVHACNLLRDSLDGQYRARVLVAPASLDQSEVKWLISRFDWFCGTRMHSTIAALSSGVPTAAISYSDKTRGVFRTCGQERWVIDPRALETDAVVSGVLAAFDGREAARVELSEALPGVKASLERSFGAIAALVRTLRNQNDPLRLQAS